MSSSAPFVGPIANTVGMSRLGLGKTMDEGEIPLGRMGEAEDIASMSVFLFSEEAKWVTGGVFVSWPFSCVSVFRLPLVTVIAFVDFFRLRLWMEAIVIRRLDLYCTLRVCSSRGSSSTRPGRRPSCERRRRRR